MEPYKAEIERGLGRGILPVLMKQLDDHMGSRWEAALLDYVRRRADEGVLGEEIVRVGRFWLDSPAVEIDAVALAGQSEEATLIGEAKWAKRVDGGRIRRSLEAKAAWLPTLSESATFMVAARERVDHAEGVLPVTAADVFAP